MSEIFKLLVEVHFALAFCAIAEFNRQFDYLIKITPRHNFQTDFVSNGL